MGFGNKVVGLEFGACLWFRFWVGSSGFRSGVEVIKNCGPRFEV